LPRCYHSCCEVASDALDHVLQKAFWQHEAGALSLLPFAEEFRGGSAVAPEEMLEETKVLIDRGSVYRISVAELEKSRGGGRGGFGRGRGRGGAGRGRGRGGRDDGVRPACFNAAFALRKS